jgi:hypothetical protein
VAQACSLWFHRQNAGATLGCGVGIISLAHGNRMGVMFAQSGGPVNPAVIATHPAVIA